MMQTFLKAAATSLTAFVYLKFFFEIGRWSIIARQNPAQGILSKKK
jgi:hypothetical protein